MRLVFSILREILENGLLQTKECASAKLASKTQSHWTMRADAKSYSLVKSFER